MSIIEQIDTVAIRVPLEHLYQGSYYRMANRCTIITRIRTSDGVVGESYNADTDEQQLAVRSIIDNELTPRVVGMDVKHIERIWEAMLPTTFDQLRDRAITMQA